ncbi:MAG TPA: septal ring lytic transglycosylase RlpA family protein [Methylomirabilota bacterium]|jgi:rare lipoprotein A
MPAPRLPALVAVSLLALLAGCSRAVVTTPITPTPEPPAAGIEEVGLASWYGTPHHGRRTASGEVYDMNQMTAAHKTLPFGTRLLVVNRDTSRTAEVRVNDRGPFVKGRILDVSYAAARQLGVTAEGVFPVRLRVISMPGGRAEAPAGPGDYTIEAGAFVTRAGAEALRREVGGIATVSETTIANQTVYRVDLGSYSTPVQARGAAQPLVTRGFPLLITPR